MREFDIEEWQNPNIVTRDGRSVRILCIDRKCGNHGGPVIALVKGKSNKYEQIIQYNFDGKQVNHDKTYPSIANYDLLINEDD